jgi:Protein of unknown function (DUF1566)
MIRIPRGVLRLLRRPLAFALTLWLCSASEAGALTPADRYVIDAASDIVTDTRTGLVWQRTVPNGTYAWDAAKAYCSGRGWRLPGLKELLTLVDVTRAMPSIDPAFPNTPAEYFWSASPYVGEAGNAFYVDFYSGRSSFEGVGAARRVRCVR